MLLTYLVSCLPLSSRCSQFHNFWQTHSFLRGPASSHCHSQERPSASSILTDVPLSESSILVTQFSPQARKVQEMSPQGWPRRIFLTFKPCLPAALFIWFDAFMWATFNINSRRQTVAAIFDNAALDDLCYPCLLQIDSLTPDILQGTIRINTWEALRKLSATWNQTARHNHETFLTSCFHPANVKLRYCPCQPRYQSSLQ